MSTWLAVAPSSCCLLQIPEPGYAEGEPRGRLNEIVAIIDGSHGGFDSVQFVRLVEPLVPQPDPLVVRDGEPKIWLPQ